MSASFNRAVEGHVTRQLKPHDRPRTPGKEFVGCRGEETFLVDWPAGAAVRPEHEAMKACGPLCMCRQKRGKKIRGFRLDRQNPTCEAHYQAAIQGIIDRTVRDRHGQRTKAQDQAPDSGKAAGG